MLKSSNKRAFLKATVATTLAAPISRWGLAETKSTDTPPVRLQLLRDRDRFIATLEVVNLRIDRRVSGPCLERIDKKAEAHLVFEFPPQHFAEFAIPITAKFDLAAPITSAVVDNIDLAPSKPARLVFRIPKATEVVHLDLDHLLDWEKFELVMPDLDELAKTTDKARRYFIGLNLFGSDSDLKRTSVVEMPWGVYLQPTGVPGRDFTWTTPKRPIAGHGRTLAWAASLQGLGIADAVVQFEVLDVRGLTKLKTDPSVHEYEDSKEYEPHKQTIECSPTTNWDRLELAASFSRRFEYTGDAATGIKTQQLLYKSGQAHTGACWVKWRTVPVTQYTISSFGGFLSLDFRWDHARGCALTAWQHTVAFGRDHFVKYTRAGFLYPFGTPAELVIQSERDFVFDDVGHLVAPLFKQAYIQIPEGSEVPITHLEAPFVAVAVTTKRTPPLDIPPSGNLIDYAMCDYFLPVVNGKAYEFEHVGTDHAGSEAPSRQPLVFVSEKSVGSNGLIFETGLPLGQPRQPAPKPQATVQCAPPGPGPAPLCSNFPSTSPTDDGLRQLDREWQQLPYRFANYGGRQVVVAKPGKPGDTTNELEWVEWVRGQVPKVDPVTNEAARPFQPRARTMRIVSPTLSQFSGSRTPLLVTYRDVRFITTARLDPEPTLPDAEYYFNRLDPEADGNPQGAYLHALPLTAINPKPASHPFAAEAMGAPAQVRNVYYGKALAGKAHPLPLELFIGLQQEARFGTASSTERTGALATPDSPVGLLTRAVGPMGDAVIDPKRWAEASTTGEKFGVPSARVDVASYRLKYRSEGRNALTEPFDLKDAATGNYPVGDAIYSLNPNDSFAKDPPALLRKTLNAAAYGDLSGISDVASLFGTDAEVLPGVRLSGVLKLASLVTSPTRTFDRRSFSRAMSSSESGPPAWQFELTGVEEILAIVGQGPGQIPLDAFAASLFQSRGEMVPAMPIKFGMKGSLDWETKALNELDLGIVVFKPQSSRLALHAEATLVIGSEKPRISASAELTNFSLVVLKALDVGFVRVSFSLKEDGTTQFDPEIGLVQFTGPLAFINNLKDLLKDLLKDYGIQLDITPSEVKVSQKILLPPASADGAGGSFYIGPASISNFNINWGVRIPIIGRDVVTINFGLATREDPMIIYVPPWYGGKAHVLIEVTTKTLRLFEVSMEYGALIYAQFSIARGEVSLMAGMTFAIAQGPNGTTYQLTAFVKAVGRLIVASIIEFGGLIMISLSYQQGDASGNKLVGEATVTVSMKIGFFRVSYSFTARHEETRGGQSGGNGATPVALATTAARAPKVAREKPQENTPFANGERRQKWSAFVKAYAY